MKEDRRRRREEEEKDDGAERRDKRRRKGRGSREREENGKCTFFLVVGAHARAIVCLRVISLPNLFYPMEIRHPSECVCVYVYTLRACCVHYVYRCNELLLCVYVYVYTRKYLCFER